MLSNFPLIKFDATDKIQINKNNYCYIMGTIAMVFKLVHGISTLFFY